MSGKLTIEMLREANRQWTDPKLIKEAQKRYMQEYSEFLQRIGHNKDGTPMKKMKVR